MAYSYKLRPSTHQNQISIIEEFRTALNTVKMSENTFHQFTHSLLLYFLATCYDVRYADVLWPSLTGVSPAVDNRWAQTFWMQHERNILSYCTVFKPTKCTYNQRCLLFCDAVPTFSVPSSHLQADHLQRITFIIVSNMCHYEVKIHCYRLKFC
jgi:hypothetical protein